jgi:hypothetical protein
MLISASTTISTRPFLIIRANINWSIVSLMRKITLLPFQTYPSGIELANPGGHGEILGREKECEKRWKNEKRERGRKVEGKFIIIIVKT